MSSAAAWLMSKNGGGGGGGMALEVTVLSAESLRLPPASYYSLIPRRLRPYVTVSSSSSSATASCSTAVAAEGTRSGEHSWNDTLVVPVGAEFFDSRGGGGGGVRVAVYSEPSCRLVGGATALGWCSVLAADVLDGLRPPRALRRLSYSLRGGGGGVVHLAVRVLGDIAPPAPVTSTAAPASTTPAQPGWCRVAMGIPVTGTSAAAAVVGMPAWAWGGETASR